MDGIWVMKQSFWAVKKGKFLRMGKEQVFLNKNVGLVRVSSWSTWVFNKTCFFLNAACCVLPFVVGGESNRHVLSCLFPDAVFGVQASITLAVEIRCPKGTCSRNIILKVVSRMTILRHQIRIDKKWKYSNPTYWVEVSNVLQQHPGHFWSLR